MNLMLRMEAAGNIPGLTFFEDPGSYTESEVAQLVNIAMTASELTMKWQTIDGQRDFVL